MAHDFTDNKVTSAEWDGKGNVGKPDTPNLDIPSMQALLDELPNILKAKYNELCQDIQDNLGDAMRSPNITNFRIANNEIQFSTDGGQTWGTTSGMITVSASPDDILMAGYQIAQTRANIIATDTLNQAMGKLEQKINELITWFTPMTQAQYDALSTYQQRIYTIVG